MTLKNTILAPFMLYLCFLPVRYKWCSSPNPGPDLRIHKISYSWPCINRAIGPCPEPVSYTILCFSAILSQPWLCLTMDPTNTCHDPGAEEATVLPGNDWDCSGTGMDLGLSLVCKWTPFERKIRVSGKEMKCVMDATCLCSQEMTLTACEFMQKPKQVMLSNPDWNWCLSTGKCHVGRKWR